MNINLDQLRAQLRRTPADWAARLELAEALVREGSGQQAAVLISTAPKDPPDIHSVLRAAKLVMGLDTKLAIRFTDRALAQDEFNVDAALLRARIHQARQEPEEAHRFAVVAAALDPQRCASEPGLFGWLAAEGLAVQTGDTSAAPTQTAAAVVAAPVEQEEVFAAPVMEEAEPEMAMLVEEEEESHQVAMIADEEDEAPEPAPAVEQSVVESTRPDAQTPAAKEESVMPVAEAPPSMPEPPTREVHSGTATAVAQIVPKAVEPANHETQPLGESALLVAPRRKSHLLQKASAITVALVVHAVLIVLLGLLVVLVPEPPVAELVGIVAPDTAEDKPQTKQVTPTAMPTPTAVAAAPARAITAAGISSISLPDFESKSEGPIAMDIATTDLGASFAMPFSPKGTSQVNFFGIKSQGKRVAFLIDAERYMLTDPRGGYPAYEIVKNEIAGMIGKLGLETYFNVILYEGTAVSAYSDKLLPATTANKEKIRDWLYPVNRDFEKLGLRPIGYPIQTVSSEIQPVEARYLSGYLRAIQYALECDVDAVFIICSGYRSMTVPMNLTAEEKAKEIKRLKWTDKDQLAWNEAVKKGQDWLKKENAARKAKGVPERVIININEVWRDMGLRPPRSPPNFNKQITAEQREDQVKNAVRLHYQLKGKPKPQINFVIFIGKDQDKDKVPYFDHFENIAQRARSGKVRVLQGLAALKNVSGK